MKEQRGGTEKRDAVCGGRGERSWQEGKGDGKATTNTKIHAIRNSGSDKATHLDAKVTSNG